MNKENDIIFDLALEVLKDQPTLQSWTFTNSELVKFAKYVVRECTHIVENLPPGYIDYRNQIEDAFRRDCIAKIQERFGVENA